MNMSYLLFWRKVFGFFIHLMIIFLLRISYTSIFYTFVVIGVFRWKQKILLLFIGFFRRLLYIPNWMRGINFGVKSREATLADYKISLLFFRQFWIIRNHNKNGNRDFVFSRFDTKQRNRGNRYSRKIRNALVFTDHNILIIILS